MIFLILGCVGLLLIGIGLAFGLLNVKTDKLFPGETPENAIKKNRRMGYLLIGLSIIIIVFTVFAAVSMDPHY